VCCSVLQCVAVCCSVLQCAAVCCSVLQCAAVCCSVPQCVTSQFAEEDLGVKAPYGSRPLCVHLPAWYGVATISRLLKIICFFCKI